MQLCDCVIGSPRDLYTRHPHAIFANSADHGLVAHLSTAFMPPTEESKDKVLREYFEVAIASGKRSLALLREANAF